MLSKRTITTLALVGTFGLTGCATDEPDDDSMIMQDTIMQQDVETVEMPVQTTDTAVVQTEVDVDTTVEVDTIDDIGGM